MSGTCYYWSIISMLRILSKMSISSHIAWGKFLAPQHEQGRIGETKLGPNEDPILKCIDWAWLGNASAGSPKKKPSWWPRRLVGAWPGSLEDKKGQNPGAAGDICPVAQLNWSCGMHLLQQSQFPMDIWIHLQSSQDPYKFVCVCLWMSFPLTSAPFFLLLWSAAFNTNKLKATFVGLFASLGNWCYCPCRSALPDAVSKDICLRNFVSLLCG